MRLPGGYGRSRFPWYLAAAAAAAGARWFVIGVAPGRQGLAEWSPALHEGGGGGFDVVSGMHAGLAAVPALARAAAARGVRLLDVRHSDRTFARRRAAHAARAASSDGGRPTVRWRRCTALALTAALRALGITATSRATRQTSIMIAGRTVTIDAVSQASSRAAE